MIKVFVSNKKIELHGHSGYDIVGKDIVCSAVSSIVTTTINGLISIDDESISYNYKNSNPKNAIPIKIFKFIFFIVSSHFLTDYNI